MTTVDWCIIALTLLVGIQGYFHGLLVGVMSAIGFLVGVYAGTHLASVVLAKGSASPYAALAGLGGALVGGVILAALFEGLGRRLRRLMVLPGLRLIDGLAGALMSAAVMLGICWVAGAALVQSASSLRLSASIRAEVEHSRILRYLDSQLPPTGTVLHALASVDPLPSLNGPSATVAAPDVTILSAAGVRDAHGSVVKIVGTACGLEVEGSGWVAGSGLVMTAAHVVAGESRTELQLETASGQTSTYAARVVLFDAHNDIAVLRVDGLSASALTLASGPVSGTSAAIVGYPENGPYKVVAARIGATEMVASGNAYGDATMRVITAVRGVVRPGNSGGPLIAGDGEVLGAVFAEVTNAPKGESEGYAMPSTLLASDLAKAKGRSAAVSTERCAA